MSRNNNIIITTVIGIHWSYNKPILTADLQILSIIIIIYYIIITGININYFAEAAEYMYTKILTGTPKIG